MSAYFTITFDHFCHFFVNFTSLGELAIASKGMFCGFLAG